MSDSIRLYDRVDSTNIVFDKFSFNKGKDQRWHTQRERHDGGHERGKHEEQDREEHTTGIVKNFRSFIAAVEIQKTNQNSDHKMSAKTETR